MKISPINFTNFRGHFDNSYCVDSLKGNKSWHLNSSYEKTLGAYHENKTGYAYFADPMEPISDKIKERADYVVYDNEPSYPDIDDISLNYFGTLRRNYKKDFEEVRQYFYRREMGGFADKAEAQYRQWQAAECVGLYDKAGDLRYKKETAEDEINKLNSKKIDAEKDLAITEKELKGQEKILENINTHINNLEKIKKSYAELNSTLQASTKNEQEMYKAAETRKEPEHKCNYDILPKDSKYQNTILTYAGINSIKQNGFKISQTVDDVKEQHNNLSETLACFVGLSTACAATIKEMKLHISNLQNKIANIDNTVKNKKSFIEDCKAKLIPLFDELKNFYAKHGLKGLKK